VREEEEEAHHGMGEVVVEHFLSWMGVVVGQNVRGEGVVEVLSLDLC